MTDRDPGDLLDGASEETPAEDGPPRYGFGAFVGDGWRVFRRDPQRLIAVFALFHVVAALIPFAFFFEVSEEAALPLILLTRVVTPVIAGSLAIAFGNRILARAAAAADGDAPASSPATMRPLDVTALTLLAAMFSMVAVVILRAYGVLILHMFYGPPIAMQVASLEGRSFRDSAGRAGALLRGNWRLILYLLNVAVVVGIVNLVLASPLYGLLSDDFELGPALAVSVLHGIVLGVLTSFFAAQQVALYEHLASRAEDDPTGLSVASDLPTPAGNDSDQVMARSDVGKGVARHEGGPHLG